jgi:transcriptional regulator with XRE-family HTH domain
MLREARERTSPRMSLRSLASMLDVSYATIDRWESGASVPKVEDVAAVLACLGVTGNEREQILSLARDSPDADWLVSGTAAISPQLAGVMDCERTAVRITECAPLGIPGLLQTADYARAVITAASDGLSDGEIDDRVRLRLARRDRVINDRAVTVSALIGEPAIRHPVTDDPAVHAAQLRQLSAHTWDHIEIRAFSLDGWHPGRAGPFIVYEFDASRPAIVYLEHYRSGAFLVDRDDVTAYQKAADKIRRAAMSAADTVALIADVITTLERTT